MDCCSACILFSFAQFHKGVLVTPPRSDQAKGKTASEKESPPNIYTMPGASTQSSPCLSVKSSASTTLSTLSPCSVPSCASRRSSLSLIDAPPMSSSMSSSGPTSPSAQAVLAMMTTPVPSPPADNESSSLVTQMMAAARAKAGWVPDAPKPPPTPLQLTAEQLDFDSRVEAAIAKSSALIAEAKAQLAAPCVAPAELTVEEKQEAHRNRMWDLQYQKKNNAIDRAMERNQALFEDVMATIDEMEEQGIPIPDCDDLLSWEWNAGCAGIPSKTPARWPGMNVLNLATKFNG